MGTGQKAESPINVARYLSGIDFPVGKQDLIHHTKQNQADQEVLDVLDKMPDQEYKSMKDVMKGVGQVE
jgi:hypothetical protein